MPTATQYSEDVLILCDASQLRSVEGHIQLTNTLVHALATALSGAAWSVSEKQRAKYIQCSPLELLDDHIAGKARDMLEMFHGNVPQDGDYINGWLGR